MDQATARRWPRYSLRTFFFATTLIAAWMAWQAIKVRERNALLARVVLDHGLIRLDMNNERRPPLIRRLMGDAGVDHFMIPSAARGYKYQLRQAFPEAQVTVLPEETIEEIRAKS